MSALPPKADIAERDCHVRFVPKADVSRCSNSRAIRSLRRRASAVLPIPWMKSRRRGLRSVKWRSMINLRCKKSWAAHVRYGS